MSAASYLETSIVLDSRRDPIMSTGLDELIEDVGIVIEQVTAEQAKIARQAYRDFGKGSGHPANLNFGDCFTYALAREKREPLLYKGDDFGHTDLRSA
jgi:ribonuclease VapC